MKNLCALEGHWNQIIQKLKIKFVTLTDDDLLLDDDLFLMEGKEAELLYRLEGLLGRTQEEIHELVFEL